MSHTVLRGKPNASQLYLDEVLNEILAAKGVVPDAKERDRLILAEIAFHCLKKRPNATNMINGSTGESFTNEQILKRAVSIARSIMARGAAGNNIMVVMRNHQNLFSIYWSLLLSGALPFMMDPSTTVYELGYFLQLLEPSIVFCDREYYNDIKKSLDDLPDLKTEVYICNEDDLLEDFINGHSNDIDSFRIPEGNPEDTILLLPTSGSTGLPKAVPLTNRGIVAHLPTSWTYHTKFPTPTDLVMVLTTAQWMTFTMKITTCAVYHIPILVTPKKRTVEHVIEIIENFRPTWTFFNPAFAKGLLAAIRPEQIESLETIILLGSLVTPDLVKEFKEKLHPDTHLCNGYGTTETQGFIAVTDRDAEASSNGWVYNILHYKLIDDNGAEVGPGSNGELYVKGECVVKGYYKNKEAYSESFVDGWYKTGDWFHLDENERLHFLERRKFNFKFRGCHVSPEEVEGVIGKLPGVHESVVVATDNGPAAAVVLLPEYDLTREDINKAVDSTLSDHKRLHGGIAFVDSLPHTHSGKLKRMECKKLIEELLKDGKCF